MFSLIGTIIIGLIVGIIAKVIMPGRDPGGFLMTTILGIAGSFVGTFVGRMFFGRYYSAGFIMSVLGAIALLAIYRMITGQRST
ncbi:MAG: GlsB/YeaQ/YmgE family stress response membrane protein [Blastocatellia bacterium]|nr:GlsB/YeaQ/YmgE family stress response membrane protein [Blastocatellia bacterium]